MKRWATRSVTIREEVMLILVSIHSAIFPVGSPGSCEEAG